MKATTDIWNAINNGYDELVELLKKNNNFIDTSYNKALDSIYAIDVIDDEIIERYVSGVRYVDDMVEIYLLPYAFGQYSVNWAEAENDDWDTFYKGDSDGYWIALRYSEVFYANTLLNIIECIEEYID